MNLPFFECTKCAFKCSRKTDIDRHMLTRKHKLVTDLRVLVTPGDAKSVFYTCTLCSKNYKSRNGLWQHKKKCNAGQQTLENLKETDENDLENESTLKELINPNSTMNKDEIIFQLLKDNQEFKNLIVEQNKTIVELAKDAKTMTINNNTTNNNKFNMNIFLNEKCKDALNIMDFVIHCSDLKRETLYIKDNDVWEKEDSEKKRIKNAIKYISLKNAKQITQWTKENEGYRDSHNKKSDTYLKLVYEANGGDDDELNKIIKNISASVIIDKKDM